MKILCDVHIAFRIVRFFQKKGIEAIHVNELPDSYFTTDKAICEFADKHGYVVLTKDADFLDSHLLQSSPLRLLKVNLGNIPTSRLLDIFENNWPIVHELFKTTKGCIEIYESKFILHNDSPE
ncbi:DUF5615 family PIN-like protein [Telluribacter sp.]|jgi:predicted nuclease of predicted toxin-antitoxin system|uniref:DUF5615 family PIN-like protein n=1 Tax=Telluribacter sp. TaxID=1978767 RepID=UPI0039C8D529